MSIGKVKTKNRQRNVFTPLERKWNFLSGFLAVVCLAICSCTPAAIEKPSFQGTVPVEQNDKAVTGGPYQHKILSASSPDGINWTRDPGVRLEHASVPCAVADGNRILLYFVDADRGPGQPESISCAISADGVNFIKQPFNVEGLTTRKALDPAVIRDAYGQFRLYYLASNATSDPAKDLEPHQIHLALSDDGINYRYDRLVFSYPGLVDPDVFVINGKWFMYVPSKDGTIIATSVDGKGFTYLQSLALKNWATETPVKLEDGSLRMYAFQEGKPSGNSVHSFISTNGIDWIEEPGDRLLASNNEKITSPSVVRWENGYKMFYKVEEPTAVTNLPPQSQSLPAPGTAGPWDQDVIVFQVNTDGTVMKTATFERAGVPTIVRLIDGRIIAAHQYFPANDPDNFDKVAVHFSSDEGKTWSPQQVLRLTGLPEGMRFPFDPTLVVLADGKIRIYFTSLYGKQFSENVPAIYSAISTNGIDYTFELGVRFGIPERNVIDCAVILHQGIFHLYSPDNGSRSDQSPRPGIGYHATSEDGIHFTRAEDVDIGAGRSWLGGAYSNGKTITFFGTQQNNTPPPAGAGKAPGGIWLAGSPDGKSWTLLQSLTVPGADPGATASTQGGWIVVATGAPRPGTPSALRSQTGQVLPVPGQQSPLLQPVDTGLDGPWNHRVLLVTSVDGLAWQVSAELTIEQASVPELFLDPKGNPILLFVDASGKTEPGVLGVVVRQDESTWVRKQTNLQGADPNVVQLKDGTYRAYTKEKGGDIRVYSSQNGLNWTLIGMAFQDERFSQATDPDVFQTPSGWVMLLSLGPRLLKCTSDDGLKFVGGEVIDLGGSVSDTVKVAGGWRTFFHVNANPQTGEKMTIRSAFTENGLKWRNEGIRLSAPANGFAQRGVADPAPVILTDGTWLMAIKSFIK